MADERPTVLIPSPGPRDRDFVREFRPWWQQAEERWWGKFVPQNVRHPYNERWRERTWSIQAAHDRKGIWLPVSWLFYFAMYAFVLGGLIAGALEAGIPAIAMYVGVYVFWRAFRKAAEDV